MTAIKPIILMADSHPLFREPRIQFDLKNQIRNRYLAIYIGVSNGDDPQFFELFRAAMERFDISETRQITSNFSEKERDILKKAQLILLSGGDTLKGFDIMKEKGMDQIIINRYHEGAQLVAVSAGAIQLGLFADSTDGSIIEMMKLVPHTVDVHQEESSWKCLRRMISKHDYITGIGIPYNSAIKYHSDKSIEVIYNRISEFRKKDGAVTESVLYPVEEKETGEVLNDRF